MVARDVAKGSRGLVLWIHRDSVCKFEESDARPVIIIRGETLRRKPSLTRRRAQIRLQVDRRARLRRYIAIRVCLKDQIDIVAHGSRSGRVGTVLPLLQDIDMDGGSPKGLAFDKASIALQGHQGTSNFVDLIDGERRIAPERAIENNRTIEWRNRVRRAGDRKACAYQGTHCAEKDNHLSHDLPPRGAIDSKFNGIITEPYFHGLSFKRSKMLSLMKSGAPYGGARPAFTVLV